MGERVGYAVRPGLTCRATGTSGDEGYYLALLHDGAAGPLCLLNGVTPHAERVRQLIMLSRTKYAGQPGDSPPSLLYGNIDAASAFAAQNRRVIGKLLKGTHVLRAFYAIDDALPIGEMRWYGATCRGSRFHGQIPPTLWVSAESGTLSMSCMRLHR